MENDGAKGRGRCVARRGRPRRNNSRGSPMTPESGNDTNNLDDNNLFSTCQVPQVGSAEVVLNTRGVPIRQNKQNRMYFDDSIVSTSPIGVGSPRRGQGQQVKTKTQVPSKSNTKAKVTKSKIPVVVAKIEPEPRVETERPKSLNEIRAAPVLPPQKLELPTPVEISHSSSHKGTDGTSAADPKQRANMVKRMAAPAFDKTLKPLPPFAPRSPSPPTKPLRKKMRVSVANRAVNMPIFDMPDLSKLSMSSSPVIKSQPHVSTSPTNLQYKELHSRQDQHPPVICPSTSTGFALSMIPNEMSFGNQNHVQENLFLDLEHVHHDQEMRLERSDPTKARQTMVEISERLKNILKLPKAHKWVCFEWFYSDMDRALFGVENDFQVCLRDYFPALKTRMLTRMEWGAIRRTMGKSRRCSNKFFQEEREDLAVRRDRVRMIQQRSKKIDWNSTKDLPQDIPLVLSIGTGVTARLRIPQDGIFIGVVEGFDISNNKYRIRFERTALGTHSVVDYEVRAHVPPDTFPLSNFAINTPRQGITGSKFKVPNLALLENNALLESVGKSPFPIDGMLGGFPIRLLEVIVRLSKLLRAKRAKNQEQKELNVEAEKMMTYGKPYPPEFRLRYAKCVTEQGAMNDQITKFMEVIHLYTDEVPQDASASSTSTSKMINPKKVTEIADKDAAEIVLTYNHNPTQEGNKVNNPKITGLIQQLTSLMLQVNALGADKKERKAHELKSMQDMMSKVRSSLEGKNLQCFQNKIELPMNRIMAGLCVDQKLIKDSK